METPGFFSYLKANKAFFATAAIIIVAVGGYFWARTGFSLEIGKFFAAEPNPVATIGTLPTTLNGVALGTISGTATDTTGVAKMHVVIRRNFSTATGGCANAQDWNGTAWVPACQVAGQIVPVFTPGTSVAWSVSNTPPLAQMTAGVYQVYVAAFRSENPLIWSGYTLKEVTFVAASAASACHNIGLFNTRAECQATCTSNADQCQFRSGDGCWRTPNGVACQAACDPFGPPNCTAIPPGTTPPPTIGGCQNAAIPWTGTYDIPAGASNFRVATYHDPKAGCTKTTTEAGTGGSVRWLPAEGLYSVKWDPSTMSSPCGRYQFDVSLVDAGGGIIANAGVGLVLNTGVDCGTTPNIPVVSVTSTCVPVDGTIQGTVTWKALPFSDPTFHVNDPIGPLVSFGTDAAITQNVGGKYTAVGTTTTDFTALMPPGYKVLPATKYYLQVIRNGGNGPEKTGVAQFTTPAACVVVTTITPPVTPITCTVTSQTNTLGAGSFGFSATGAPKGLYNWYAPGGTPATQVSPGTFNASYTTPGTKTVTVSSGGNMATCVVVIQPAPVVTTAPPLVQHLACQNNACVLVDGAGANSCTTVNDCLPPLTCAPTQSNLTPGGTQTFTATGGVQYCDGDICYPANAYKWSTSDNQVFSNSATYFRSFTVPGNYTITVKHGLRSAVCNVTVAIAPTHSVCENNACVIKSGAGTDACTTNADCAPLACAPATQSVTSGQSATANATGGTRAYAWQATGGTPASGGDVASFSSIFTNTTAQPVTRSMVVSDSAGRTATCNVVVAIAPTHAVCENNACVVKQGAGTTTCTTNADCAATPALTCSPATRTLAVNQSATWNAGGGTGPFTWSAPSAKIPTGSGSNFDASYASAGSYTITVTDSKNQTAQCAVTVPVVTTTNPITCAPVTRTIGVGQTGTCTAGGGTGTYTWSAPSSQTPSGSGTNFDVSYLAPGSYTVTVTDSSNNSAQCAVVVPAVVTTITAPPTSPALTIQKLVRNVTQGGTTADSVNANPTDIVEFSLQVSSVGTGPATDVIVRDTLPTNLTYQAGSTTIDNVSAADGVIGSGINLGTMNPGRTITVRFRAQVATEQSFSVGTSVLVNTGYAKGTNTSEQSDIAFVNVTRNPAVLSMTLTKLGYNVTRGESSEHSPVTASPNDTLMFVIRVKNTSSAQLNNVVISDVIPQGITLIAGTTKLNGVGISDTLTTGGAAIGSLAVGQEAVITFQGRVAAANQLPTGTTTLINTAQASADTIATLTAQLPIIITNPVITTVVQVPTGPGESTVLALIVSAIVTLLYVGYTSTQTYRRRQVGAIVDQSKKERDLFDFRR